MNKNAHDHGEEKESLVGPILLGVITALLFVILFLVFFMSFLSGPLLILALAGVVFWAAVAKTGGN